MTGTREGNSRSWTQPSPFRKRTRGPKSSTPQIGTGDAAARHQRLVFCSHISALGNVSQDHLIKTGRGRPYLIRISLNVGGGAGGHACAGGGGGVGCDDGGGAALCGTGPAGLGAGAELGPGAGPSA